MRKTAVLYPLKRYKELPRDFPLSEPVITVGRLRTNDIVLPFDSVSRQHAKIEFRDKDKKVILSDLDSRNGSFVNAKRVNMIEIFDGDIVSFGDVEFLFSYISTDLKSDPSKEGPSVLEVSFVSPQESGDSHTSIL